MQNQRNKFTLPAGVTYLNCAYMSPLLKSVEAAGMAGMKKKRNPISISAADFFTDTEILRKEFAKLLHTSASDRMVVVPSVSYGLANVAKNVKMGSGEKIIVAGEEFPSNYYSWQRLCDESGGKLNVIAPPESLNERGKRWNERILEAIDSKTKLVALGNVHWADGTRFDLEKIRKRTRETGTLLVIDGTQSVGALTFDINKIQPDALVCGGYKWLMGPYSMGLAYYGETFDNGVPIEENWINRNDSEDFTSLVNYNQEYQRGSLRYEVGEHSNFILIPMMMEALRQILRWTPDGIQSYCQKISAEFIGEIKAMGCWVEDPALRGHHLFGIRFPKAFPLEKVRAKLKKRKIAVSFRGDSMRVSANVFNSAADFDRLLVALK